MGVDSDVNSCWVGCLEWRVCLLKGFGDVDFNNDMVLGEGHY